MPRSAQRRSKAWLPVAAVKAEQAIRHRLAVVGEGPGDRHRRGALQVAQDTARIGRRFRRVDADEDPSGGAVERHEQIRALRLVRHLRQEFHVDRQLAGLIGLAGRVRRSPRRGLQRAEVAHAMPPQATVELGARQVRIEDLPHHREQVVERKLFRDTADESATGADVSVV